MDRELKQLIDKDSDLMIDFRNKATGTFRHCDSVASLVDSICEELDYLNRDELYVAAKLHDIGKSVMPHMFSENQKKDENIHDSLDTDISFLYLSKHVSDSLLILLQYNEIPRKVLEYISQHHGNTPIKSICKTEDDYKKYRYQSVPPKSVEACVLMICDVVEAATRAFFTSNKLKDIKETITKLIDSLVEDKQLDYLKIGELRVIRKVLIKEIGNLYHKRVDYNNDDVISNDEVDTDSTS